MNNSDYTILCENVFSDWKSNSLKIEDSLGVDLDALPEPYVTFGTEPRPISYLTTNPGGVMDFQRKSSSFFTDGENFQSLSRRLANHYERFLRGTARTRIASMYGLAKRLNKDCNGFVQYEISPFHSSTFQGKEVFAKRFFENKLDEFHKKYVDSLAKHIGSKNCICLQAGFPDLSRLGQNWLRLISYVMSVAINDWKVIHFKVKDGRPTTGAFYYRDTTSFKVILFNSSSNTCPRLDTMYELIELLR